MKSCLLREVGKIYKGKETNVPLNVNLREPISVYKKVQENLSNAAQLAKLYVPKAFKQLESHNGVEYIMVESVRKNAQKKCATENFSVFRPSDSDNLEFGLKLVENKNKQKTLIDMDRNAFSYLVNNEYFGAVEVDETVTTTETLQNQIETFNRRLPWVSISGEYSVGRSSEDDDTVTVVCQRPARYASRSYGSFMHLKKFSDSLLTSIEHFKPKLGSIIKSVEGGITRDIQDFVALSPSPMLLKLSNLVNELGKESTWSSAINFKTITETLKLLKEISDSKFFDSIRFSANEKTKNWIASNLNIPLPITSNSGKFTISATTSKQNDFLAQGTATLDLALDKDAISIFEILPIISPLGKALQSKYLALSRDHAFVFDDLDLLQARNCNFDKKDEVCDLSNLPISQTQIQCAKSIMNDKTSGCPLVAKNGVVAYRAQCSGDSIAMATISASSNSLIHISCPDQPPIPFLIPPGLTKLKTGCSIAFQGEKIIGTDLSSEFLQVPDPIPVASGLEGQQRDFAIGFGTGGSIIVLGIIKFLLKCILNKCHYKFSFRHGFEKTVYEDSIEEEEFALNDATATTENASAPGKSDHSPKPGSRSRSRSRSRSSSKVAHK